MPPSMPPRPKPRRPRRDGGHRARRRARLRPALPPIGVAEERSPRMLHRNENLPPCILEQDGRSCSCKQNDDRIYAVTDQGQYEHAEASCETRQQRCAEHVARSRRQCPAFTCSLPHGEGLGHRGANQCDRGQEGSQHQGEASELIGRRRPGDEDGHGEVGPARQDLVSECPSKTGVDRSAPLGRPFPHLCPGSGPRRLWAALTAPLAKPHLVALRSRPMSSCEAGSPVERPGTPNVTTGPTAAGHPPPAAGGLHVQRGIDATRSGDVRPLTKTAFI